MNNSGIPFVNVQQDISISQIEGPMEDPFAGVHVESQKPQLYWIEDKIFAEPLPNDIVTDSASDGEVTYYNQFAVRQSPGRKTKKYDLKIKKDDLTCPQERCGKTFTKSDLLKSHIRRVHCKDTTKYQCHLCAAGFPAKHLLNRHLAVHSGDKKKCPICCKSISARTSLSTHLKSHENRTFQCDVCSRILKSRRSMVVHLHYVHRTGQLTCNMCALKFTKTVEYRRHKATHQERNIACEFCGTMMPTLSALGVHKRIHEAQQFSHVEIMHK